MATTAKGTPYVESSDLVANYPAVSLALAEHIDDFGGKVLQVVEASYSTEVTVASTSYTDTGLSATITPTSSSNSILIVISQQFEVYRDSLQAGHGLQILRASTPIFTPDVNRFESGWVFANSTKAGLNARVPLIYFDSPATTSATTYKTQGAANSTANGGYVKYQANTSTSTILLIEVSA